MKLLDRKRQAEPSKELPDVLKLLEAARHTLAEKQAAETEAKRERDENQDIAEDAFSATCRRMRRCGSVPK